jgi:hypothetical protein
MMMIVLQTTVYARGLICTHGTQLLSDNLTRGSCFFGMA